MSTPKNLIQCKPACGRCFSNRANHNNNNIIQIILYYFNKECFEKNNSKKIPIIIIIIFVRWYMLAVFQCLEHFIFLYCFLLRNPLLNSSRQILVFLDSRFWKKQKSDQPPRRHPNMFRIVARCCSSWGTSLPHILLGLLILYCIEYVVIYGHGFM